MLVHAFLFPFFFFFFARYCTLLLTHSPTCFLFLFFTHRHTALAHLPMRFFLLFCLPPHFTRTLAHTFLFLFFFAHYPTSLTHSTMHFFFLYLIWYSVLLACSLMHLSRLVLTRSSILLAYLPCVLFFFCSITTPPCPHTCLCISFAFFLVIYFITLMCEFCPCSNMFTLLHATFIYPKT